MPPRTPLAAHIYPDQDYRFMWDDLRAPASSINPQGQTAGADIDPDDSSLLFASNATETAAVILQMPHSWREGSNVRPHIHWAKTTDAAGDVTWQIRYRVFNVGDVTPAWSDWAGRTSRSKAVASDQTHLIDGFAEMDMSDMTLSAIISVQIRRKHDDAADDYGADARLWEFDCHYQVDSLGSIEEYTKEEVS